MKTLKHVFAAALVLLGGLTLMAQVTVTSSFLAGGSVSFNSSNSTVEVTEDGVSTQRDGPTTSTFTFEPIIAYFIMPNFAFGGQISYTREKVDSDLQNYKVDNLLVGPIARYYWPFMEGKAAVFLEADAAFGSSSDNIDLGGQITSTDNSVSKFGAGPGITFFIDDLVGLEAIATYSYVRSTADVESPTISYKSTSEANEFDFQIGLQFYFARY
jgi:hypothetical protein